MQKNLAQQKLSWAKAIVSKVRQKIERDSNHRIKMRNLFVYRYHMDIQFHFVADGNMKYFYNMKTAYINSWYKQVLKVQSKTICILVTKHNFTISNH